MAHSHTQKFRIIFSNFVLSQVCVICFQDRMTIKRNQDKLLKQKKKMFVACQAYHLLDGFPRYRVCFIALLKPFFLPYNLTTLLGDT